MKRLASEFEMDRELGEWMLTEMDILEGNPRDLFLVELTRNLKLNDTYQEVEVR